MSSNNKWPKKSLLLDSSQEEIKEDFYNYWLTTYLPTTLNSLEKFNHGFPLGIGFFDNCKTLEIGAGVGGHLKYEDLDRQMYVAMDLREEFAKKIQSQYPNVKTIVGDCQERIDVNDGYFDRVLAIHVLEHLPNLPAALGEIRRVLRPNEGKFIVIIPCEGGLAHKLGRYFTTRRLFEKKYNQSYDWFIDSEHLNLPDEIILELCKVFKIEKMVYFPLRIPIVSLNLCIGIVLAKRDKE